VVTAAAPLQVHPDEVPCVIALPLTGGHPDHLACVATETRAP
jgi:periplasmic divalent cation tolerance protein